MALGHVRYSTTGANSWENSQPVYRADRREVALGHNGNLVNAVELHPELREARRHVPLDVGLRDHRRAGLHARGGDGRGRAGRRDRPRRGRLQHGRDDQGPRRRVPRSARACARCRSACSATTLLRRVARPARSTSSAPVPARRPAGRDRLDHQARACRRARRCRRRARALCVFEHIYFARPDSRLGGQVIQVSRGRMGEILAREAPVDADLVIPVPDSGNPAARGFARASGLPQDDGLIKNRYVARTFIQPGQELRKHGLRLKFNPLPEVVAGKRIVVVDDSIVRGNTTRQIVQMLRDAGASEVHMRISAPPIRHPCHYGIDMSTREEMIAHNRTEAEVAAELGADSLAYLSLEGVYEAISRHARDALRRVLLGGLPTHRYVRQGRLRARPSARSELTHSQEAGALRADWLGTMPLKHILIPASLAALLIAGCGGGEHHGRRAKTPAKRGGTLTVPWSGDVDSIDPGHDLLLRRLHGRQRHPAHADGLRARPRRRRAPTSPTDGPDGQRRRQDRHGQAARRRALLAARQARGDLPPTSSTRSSAASSAPSTTRTRPPTSATSSARSSAPSRARRSPASRRRTSARSCSSCAARPAARSPPRSCCRWPRRCRASTRCRSTARRSPSYGLKQVATGPYMVGSYEPGKNITLVRNPTWNAKTDFRPAYLDRIEMPQGNDDPIDRVAPRSSTARTWHRATT